MKTAGFQSELCQISRNLHKIAGFHEMKTFKSDKSRKNFTFTEDGGRLCHLNSEIHLKSAGFHEICEIHRISYERPLARNSKPMFLVVAIYVFFFRFPSCQYG